MSLQQQIQNFKVKSNKNFYESWERFKELQRARPHHWFAPDLLIRFFYFALPAQMKQLVSSHCMGDVLSYPLADCITYFDKLAKQVRGWEISPSGTDSRNHSNASGVFQLDLYQFNEYKNSLPQDLLEPSYPVQDVLYTQYQAGGNYRQPGTNYNSQWDKKPYVPGNHDHPGFSYGNPNAAANAYMLLPQNQVATHSNFNNQFRTNNRFLTQEDLIRREERIVNSFNKIFTKFITYMNQKCRLPAQAETNPRIVESETEKEGGKKNLMGDYLMSMGEINPKVSEKVDRV